MTVTAFPAEFLKKSCGWGVIGLFFVHHTLTRSAWQQRFLNDLSWNFKSSNATILLVHVAWQMKMGVRLWNFFFTVKPTGCSWMNWANLLRCEWSASFKLQLQLVASVAPCKAFKHNPYAEFAMWLLRINSIVENVEELTNSEYLKQWLKVATFAHERPALRWCWQNMYRAGRLKFLIADSEGRLCWPKIDPLFL